MAATARRRMATPIHLGGEDGAIVLAVGNDPPAFAQAVVDAAKRRRKPVVGVAVGAPRNGEILVDGGIPVYPTPARAARAYQALVPLPL